MDAETAKEYLQGLISPGTKFYGVERKKSRSGERLFFDICIVNTRGEIERITAAATAICGFKWSAKNNCIYMDGFQYCKGSHAVDQIHHALGGSEKDTKFQWL